MRSGSSSILFGGCEPRFRVVGECEWPYLPIGNITIPKCRKTIYFYRSVNLCVVPSALARNVPDRCRIYVASCRFRSHETFVIASKTRGVATQLSHSALTPTDPIRRSRGLRG